MRQIVAIVETTDHNLAAFLEGIDGIIAIGHNVEELKKSMEESIAAFLETAEEFGNEIPDVLQGEYEIVYRYDMCSFLKAYAKILGKAEIEHITGVNQKQLWHYASGMSKPRQTTVNKIAKSLHDLGHELQNIEFIC